MAKQSSQAERLTQVHLTHLGVGKDFFRRSGRDHSSLIYNVCAAANAESLAYIMVGDEHADVAARQLPDDALDVEHREWIDARKRLIEQHETRLSRECARDFHAPPLPARQRYPQNLADVADAQLFEELLEPPLARRAVEILSRFEDREHVVLHGELAEDGRLLGEVPEPQLGAFVHCKKGEILLP